jgi:hypothetical protein
MSVNAVMYFSANFELQHSLSSFTEAVHIAGFAQTPPFRARQSLCFSANFVNDCFSSICSPMEQTPL